MLTEQDKINIKAKIKELKSKADEAEQFLTTLDKEILAERAESIAKIKKMMVENRDLATLYQDVLK